MAQKRAKELADSRQNDNNVSQELIEVIRTHKSTMQDLHAMGAAIKVRHMLMCSSSAGILSTLLQAHPRAPPGTRPPNANNSGCAAAVRRALESEHAAERQLKG
jgi:hypothetical protein